MANSKKEAEPVTFKKVVNNLLIIAIIAFITFLGISFISGAPELTDKFLIYFGIFLVSIEVIALIVWQVARLLKKQNNNESI